MSQYFDSWKGLFSNEFGSDDWWKSLNGSLGLGALPNVAGDLLGLVLGGVVGGAAKGVTSGLGLDNDVSADLNSAQGVASNSNLPGVAVNSDSSSASAQDYLAKLYEYNQASAQAQMNYQTNSAREAMAYQSYMSNTAHQRAVSDMTAAGLNPILAAGNPASTPSGVTQSGSYANVDASAFNTLINAQVSLKNTQDNLNYLRENLSYLKSKLGVDAVTSLFGSVFSGVTSLLRK